MGDLQEKAYQEGAPEKYCQADIKRFAGMLYLDKDSWCLKWRRRHESQFKSPKYCASWNARYADNIAGGLSPKGYVRIMLWKKLHMAHKIIWAFTYGSWPSNLLDHKDGNKANNNPDNLREADNSKNQHNVKSRGRNSSSGLLGVHKHGDRWSAKIEVKGIGKKWLGCFDDPEEAHAVYMAAKKELVGVHRND